MPMLIPYVVSAVFILAVVAVCFWRPNAGRIFLGFFYIAMGLVVHGAFILTNPQSYVDFGQGALIPIYRELTTTVIALSPVLFGAALLVFETLMGLLLLNKGQYVRLGLIGTTLFILALTPLSTLQFVWLGLVVAQGYLLTKEFDSSFLEMVRSRRPA
jgi:hypothetical protein